MGKLNEIVEKIIKATYKQTQFWERNKMKKEKFDRNIAIIKESGKREILDLIEKCKIGGIGSMRSYDYIYNSAIGDILTKLRGEEIERGN